MAKKQMTKKTNDDTTTTLADETAWFDATMQWPTIRQFCRAFSGARDLTMLSVFDHSKKVQSKWQRHGYSSVAVDVLNEGVNHDITTEIGFYTILTLILRLAPRAMCMWAPPCSLFVFMSSSLHKRGSGKFDASGDTSVRSVRLANLIARNAAMLVKVCLKFRHDCFLAVEQPLSSKMWLLKEWQEVIHGFHLKRSLTYQGLFGALLVKATVIMHNFPSDTCFSRRLTKANKAWFKKKIAGMKNLPAFYIVKDGQVTGTKSLQATAIYPAKFVTALFNQWLAARS